MSSDTLNEVVHGAPNSPPNSLKVCRRTETAEMLTVGPQGNCWSISAEKVCAPCGS